VAPLTDSRELPKVLVFLGTRPEAIKMAPVVRALRQTAALDLRTVSTGQHGRMLSDVLIDLDWKPDRELSSMRAGQSLSALYANLLELASLEIYSFRPKLVIVHGDTATALATSQAAFLSGVPVAHVEAGLRTNNLLSPFPEEMNRQLIARLATLNFAPTQDAVNQLTREGIERGTIRLVGNTIVDATEWAFREKLSCPPEETRLRSAISESAPRLRLDEGFALLTLHRRENSEKFRQILDVVKEVCDQHPNFQVLFPVHPNPAIRQIAHEILEGCQNVSLVSPLGYLEFLYLMSKARFILSDSGGIQEEGVTLSKQVLLVRDTTERPEGLSSGFVEMVGTDPERIRARLLSLISSGEAGAQLNLESNPFGDGRAALRIAVEIAAMLKAK
jgi:UDP-N-acetylglucosamine 2-epimerase